MYDNNGLLKLIDFGEGLILKNINNGNDREQGHNNYLTGKITYASPEKSFL